MLIEGTSVSVNYRKIEGIKRAYYKNEKILKEFFNEATVLPIPDDAPVEIPRIIIKTLHEHAKLQITPTTATFEVHFNDGFERDWNSCSRYITERMNKVLEFLNILTSDNYEYIGIVSRILFDDVKQDGAKYLTRTLLNPEKIKDIYDINVRYTFVEGSNIFVNVMLQNARLFKEGTPTDKAGSLSEANQISESIGAIIDINDRYGFNTNSNYKSGSYVLDTLTKSMSNVINNKLRNLIERGEY
jgi:hypothetical protein